MDVEFSELHAHAPGVRLFAHERRPGFAECAPSGRMRLDAIAGWLQDVAYDDVRDAGLERSAVWVVRRTRLRVNRFPRFGEHFTVSTFCSGFGRMWAERRTDVIAPGADAPDVEAVSLWVHLDTESWRPSPLTAEELAIYGGTPARRVSARLRHPPPPADAAEPGTAEADPLGTWTFRATECDIADHVNNAAYWTPLEEELLRGEAPDPPRFDAELEYRVPAQPGVKRILRDADRRWIVASDGEVHASLRIVG